MSQKTAKDEEMQITRIFKEWIEGQNIGYCSDVNKNNEQASIVDTFFSLTREKKIDLLFQISVSDGRLREHAKVNKRLMEKYEEIEAWDVDNVGWIKAIINKKEKKYPQADKNKVILLIKTPITLIEGEIGKIGEVQTEFMGIYLIHSDREITVIKSGV